MTQSCISLIVAMTPDHVIGRDNTIPWRLPTDMAYFKQITMGHPLITGRKNWESIPAKFRPLPGRANIVVTGQKDYVADGATVVSSIEDAFAAAASAPGAEEIFIIGGGDLYRQCIDRIQKAYVTIVHAHVSGDVLFEANFKMPNWRQTSPADSLHTVQNDKDEHPMSFLVFERING